MEEIGGELRLCWEIHIPVHDQVTPNKRNRSHRRYTPESAQWNDQFLMLLADKLISRPPQVRYRTKSPRKLTIHFHYCRAGWGRAGKGKQSGGND
ncbi:hypothetical protein J6590_039317 [Homalodisca vitripennis]|nr:hypothetical protein J6590_039317 [Homalodisca vitripennis]